MPYAARKTLKTLSAVFVATLALLAMPAVAVEFGALTLKSNLGESLLAEIPIRAESGDVLDSRCIKVSASNRASLPVVADVGLQMITRGAESILLVQSALVLVEPAALLLLEANCGSGRVWHEFPVLPKPARPGIATTPTSTARVTSLGEWVVAPGESPLSLAQVLFPKQIAVQRRFIQALMEANPAAGINSAGTKPLLAGSLLTMPDWRTLGVEGMASETRHKVASEPKHQTKIRFSDAEKAGVAIATDRDGATGRLVFSDSSSLADSLPASPLQLRLSSMLQLLPDASERLRDVLRLEYQLLRSLNEQLVFLKEGLAPDSVSAVRDSAIPIPVLVSATAIAKVPEAVSALPPADAEKASEPAPSARIKALPAAAPEASAMGNEWLPFTVLGLALLLAVLWLRRRAVVVATPRLDELQTLVMEPPAGVRVPSVSSAKMKAEVPAEETSPSVVPKLSIEPAPVSASVAAASAEVIADSNPVMELAEIMLSFGRLDGAAQTLQEYIETNPKEALQPWMKLLDIYRMGGMNAEFEVLANKLNQNFNVEVQHWEPAPVSEPDDENQLYKAISIEELPHLCEQITAKWGTPACLDYLHQLLRDNRGGKRSGFTLPVVQEVLLLIDILVARESTGTN